MIYDIRTSEKALKTLVELTGVSKDIWDNYMDRINDYPYIEKMIEEVVKRYGHLPHSYRDFEFVYFHITTSKENCRSIKNTGIFDLCKAYENKNSELRVFLDNKGIAIDLKRRILWNMIFHIQNLKSLVTILKNMLVGQSVESFILIIQLVGFYRFGQEVHMVV